MFYVLDLSGPTCLTRLNGEPVLPKVTSVHVETNDAQRKALLDMLRDKRVTVRFSSVFERSEDYHRRPLVGMLEAVTADQ